MTSSITSLYSGASFQPLHVVAGARGRKCALWISGPASVFAAAQGSAESGELHLAGGDLVDQVAWEFSYRHRKKVPGLFSGVQAMMLHLTLKISPAPYCC